MLRLLMAISVISLTLSCAHKDAGKGLLKLSGLSAADEDNVLEQSEDPFDSTYFIGYVDYFPDTREFYTSLYHREGYEYPDADLLESKLDSVIVYDEDWGRERLPMEEAKKFLVLSGLDTLLIFNRKNQQVCACPLARVEYLWNGLDSYFIAVFRADRDFPGQSEELFGISANFPASHLTPLLSEELDDEAFDQFMLRKLDLNVADNWEMRHYQVTPPDGIFSTISSFPTSNQSTRSYLAFFEKNKIEVFNEEVDNYHYLNILPIPIQVNGKPLLLISAGYPASDVLWDYLAGYDGNQYEAIDNNRIHLRDVARQWPPVLSQAQDLSRRPVYR